MNWTAIFCCAGVANAIFACTSTSTRVSDADDDITGAGTSSAGRSSSDGGSAGRQGTAGAPSFGGASPSAGRSGTAGTSGAATAGTPGSGGSSAGASGNESGGTDSGGEPGQSEGGEAGGPTTGTSCTPNPCLNDGICTAQGSSYRCECVHGESGAHCEVPCNLSDVTIQFEDLIPSQRDKYENNGVEIFGSADLVFSDDASPGLGIAGGTGDWLVDGTEFVTFRFDRPAQNVSYYVPGSIDSNSNDIWGESTIEAFDAAGATLGMEVATDNGKKNVSVLFDDEPISKFTIRLKDGDGVVLGNVSYSICMSP